eukprot:1140377-Pelagomonas_calceolata.AAC.10
MTSKIEGDRTMFIQPEVSSGGRQQRLLFVFVANSVGGASKCYVWLNHCNNHKGKRCVEMKSLRRPKAACIKGRSPNRKARGLTRNV